MDFIRRWWWPVFVFLYPLAFWPKLPNSLSDTFNARIYLTILFLVGGLILLLLSNPQTRLTDIRKIPSFLIHNKAVAIAAIYGLWTLVAASLSPNPAVAFTGQLDGFGDGALWTCGMVILFIMVFLQLKQDRQLIHHILWALVLSGAVLASLSLIEVLVGRPLIANARPDAVPTVMFPQRGHLAGYLVLTLGIALGYWYRGAGRIPGWAFGLALGIGMTNNRAALLATGFMALFGLRNLRRLTLIVIAITAGITVGSVLIKSKTPQSVREVGNSSTLFIRAYYWKAATRGILDRPIIGWGGGVFGYAWPKYMTKAEIARYIQEEWAAGELVSYQYSVGIGQPVFVVKDAQGRLSTFSVRSWKAHNEFLEQALMWGLVGLGLYLVLLWFVVVGALRGEPGSIGLIGYHAFLMFWFVFLSSQAVVWVLLAVAAFSFLNQEIRQPKLADPKLTPSVR
jgi:hypothetical protein